MGPNPGKIEFFSSKRSCISTIFAAFIFPLASSSQMSRSRVVQKGPGPTCLASETKIHPDRRLYVYRFCDICYNTSPKKFSIYSHLFLSRLARTFSYQSFSNVTFSYAQRTIGNEAYPGSGETHTSKGAVFVQRRMGSNSSNWFRGAPKHFQIASRWSGKSSLKWALKDINSLFLSLNTWKHS